MSDQTIWACVMLVCISIALIVVALVRPPWKPLRDEEWAQQGGAGGGGAAGELGEEMRAQDRPAAHHSAAAGAGGGRSVEDEPDESGPRIVREPASFERSRWRPSVALCIAIEAAGLLLFLVALGIDSWERVRLAAIVPIFDPSGKPVYTPIDVPISFGLGSRRVSLPDNAAQTLNGTEWASGAYSNLCSGTASVLGCALGFQSGTLSVLLHGMLGLAVGAALLLYVLLAWRCASNLLRERHEASTRKSLLECAWRAALVQCICVLMAPILWALTSHISMRIRVPDAALGPSWVVSLVAALAAPLVLWCSRRSLQLLHSERHSSAHSGRLLEQELQHAYHLTPASAAVPPRRANDRPASPSRSQFEERKYDPSSIPASAVSYDSADSANVHLSPPPSRLQVRALDLTPPGSSATSAAPSKPDPRSLLVDEEIASLEEL